MGKGDLDLILFFSSSGFGDTDTAVSKEGRGDFMVPLFIFQRLFHFA